MTTKIPLQKPIEAHGEQVSELELTTPTTGDIIDLGDPMTINEDGAVHFKNDIVAKYVSKLGKIPLHSVRQLAIADFLTCKKTVAGFLSE